MKTRIYRGTHQIGGIAAEFTTEHNRILIDMGDELSLEPDFVPAPLSIPGVTDHTKDCDAVLFTHYHGDHVGQMGRIREDIPLYAGELCKEIMRLAASHFPDTDPLLLRRIEDMRTFLPGKAFAVGDFRITPFSVDHSACDSYMFLLEADGKRILYTGDFRLHGIRGKGIPKVLEKLVGKVDAVITEGTALSRKNQQTNTEWDLQNKVREYLQQYKYVFALCATTNLDRIFAFSRAVPRGKYCLCDEYQLALVKAVSERWEKYSEFYQMPKLCTYGENLETKFQERGGLMFVRANQKFSQIIRR